MSTPTDPFRDIPNARDDAYANTELSTTRERQAQARPDREDSPGAAATEAHRRGVRDGGDASRDSRPAVPYTPVPGIEPRHTASYWNGWEHARAAGANAARTTRTRSPR